MVENKTESQNRPLQGIRILDLTQMLAGPFGAMFLGDLGAEVLKVEPIQGDFSRGLPPYFPSGDSAYFWSINRNKKSMAIDLKSPEGLKIFYEMVAHADVVFDNFRPGVLERLKIDYENLKIHNSKIICCSVSTFGSTGPYSDRPGYDLIVQAMSGGMSLTGEPGGSPVRAGISIGDLMGGLLAVHGILAAYIALQKTGRGQRLEVSLLEGQLFLLTYIAQHFFTAGKVPGPHGSGDPSLIPYQAFKTKDIHIAVAAHREHFFEGLCKVLGKPEWNEDPRFSTLAARRQNQALLLPMIEEILKTRRGEEWVDELVRADVPAGPIHTLDRAFSDPHVLFRGTIVEVDGPEGKKVKTIANPLKMDEMPLNAYACAPRVGEHTGEILSTILGYSQQTVEAFHKKGVIRLSEKKTDALPKKE
jgi:crotonobetainyl-CoA:carnitine CoA-transferase CaiB-like acyl-CoA transferase